MDSVNVLVVFDVGEAGLRQIAGVRSKIVVLDATAFYSGVMGVATDKRDDYSREKFNALLAQAEVIFGNISPEVIIGHAPRLKWIQTMTAGVDRLLIADIVNSRIKVTTTSGIHATPVSELVFETMLMFAKQAPLCFQMKQNKQWQSFVPSLLREKTIGIVGLGSIGRGVAHLAK